MSNTFRDPITLVVEGGQRLLRGGNIRTRILTEEKLQSLNDDDFHNYRKRLAFIVDRANRGPQMTNPETIRAYDYIRKAVERETLRREPGA